MNTGKSKGVAFVGGLTLEEQLHLAASKDLKTRKLLACFSTYAEVNDVLRKDTSKSVRLTARVCDPRLSGAGDSTSAAAAVIAATII